MRDVIHYMGHDWFCHRLTVKKKYVKEINKLLTEQYGESFTFFSETGMWFWYNTDILCLREPDMFSYFLLRYPRNIGMIRDMAEDD